MPKLDLTAYKNLSEAIKPIATKYFAACVKERLNAKNINSIADELMKLNGDVHDTRKLFNKHSGYWYKKFDGQAFDDSTVFEIERLLPNISHSLLLPLWQILDVYVLNPNDFSSAFNSISSKFAKQLLEKDNATLGIRKSVQFKDIAQITKDYSIEALACLTLLAKEIMQPKQLSVIENHSWIEAPRSMLPMKNLQYMLIEIRNLVFILCLDTIFQEVYFDVYQYLYKELFSRESSYLKPLHDNDFKSEQEFHQLNDGHSVYPFYYAPTYYEKPVKLNLDKHLAKIAEITKAELDMKYIKQSEIQKTFHKYVCYQFHNGQNPLGA